MVRIELATTSADIDRALDLAEAVWGVRPITTPMMRALELAGSYVSIAVDGDHLIGMCAGFVGVHPDGLHLHSHLAAVAPAARGRGVGRALKRHQRSWCLDHDIRVVTWTFDPLVRENARFNLHVLGAAGDRYLVDLYGAIDDDINVGHPTDRLLMRWDLDAAEAMRALDGPRPSPVGQTLRDAGAVDLVRFGSGGAPEAHRSGSDVRLISTPPAVVEMRHRDPDRALAWRTAVRAAMTSAFADGLSPVGMSDDHAYVCCRRAS